MQAQIEEHYKNNSDRLRLRDEALNGAYVASIRGKMSKYAYRMLGNWEDAEDAVQDCYERVLRYQTTFKEGSDFDSWVWIILINVINNIRKGKTNEPTIVEATDNISVDEYLTSSESPEESVTLLKWGKAFDSLSLKLSTRDVSILQLYFLYGHTMPDVSQILDVNIHTIQRVIHENRKSVIGG